MVMNKQKGNMYGFVTHTYNPIKGLCSHDCKYCYMKRFGNLKPIRIVESELGDLGFQNFIFVGSSIDMFAEDVPEEWIEKVLINCDSYAFNSYLFQTKNPKRFLKFVEMMPEDTTIGTTLESNKDYNISKAPIIEERVRAIEKISKDWLFPIMITIEPILDFDFLEFVALIKRCKPKWVNVGADSQGHNLPEPNKQKILDLINELRKFTEVRIKNNLKRICPT